MGIHFALLLVLAGLACPDSPVPSQDVALESIPPSESRLQSVGTRIALGMGVGIFPVEYRATNLIVGYAEHTASNSMHVIGPDITFEVRHTSSTYPRLGFGVIVGWFAVGGPGAPAAGAGREITFSRDRFGTSCSGTHLAIDGFKKVRDWLHVMVGLNASMFGVDAGWGGDLSIIGFVRGAVKSEFILTNHLSARVGISFGPGTRIGSGGFRDDGPATEIIIKRSPIIQVKLLYTL